MKIILTALLVFPFAAFAQELKEVTKKNQDFTETYSVLKSDKKVKEGKYLKTKGKAVVVSGFYKNNKKDSTWVTYSGPRKLGSKGNFKNDLRVGVWDFFDSSGQLESSYDYTKNQLVFHKERETAMEFLVRTESGFVPKKLSRKPLTFPSADPSGENNTIIYPFPAQVNGIVGTVYVSWIIDQTGFCTEPVVEKPLGYGLDEEAIRVATFVRNQVWLPGILDGEPVAVKFTLPIKFGVR